MGGGGQLPLYITAGNEGGGVGYLFYRAKRGIPLFSSDFHSSIREQLFITIGGGPGFDGEGRRGGR